MGPLKMGGHIISVVRSMGRSEAWPISNNARTASRRYSECRRDGAEGAAIARGVVAAAVVQHVTVVGGAEGLAHLDADALRQGLLVDVDLHDDEAER